LVRGSAGLTVLIAWALVCCVGSRTQLLKRHDYRLIAPPESFVVTKQNTLADGESSRARRRGAALAAMAALEVPTA